MNINLCSTCKHRSTISEETTREEEIFYTSERIRLGLIFSTDYCAAFPISIPTVISDDKFEHRKQFADETILYEFDPKKQDVLIHWEEEKKRKAEFQKMLDAKYEKDGKTLKAQP